MNDNKTNNHLAKYSGVLIAVGYSTAVLNAVSLGTIHAQESSPILATPLMLSMAAMVIGLNARQHNR